MEENAARSLWQGEGLFFMWRVDPTVICGRNQDIPHEVDLDYCRERGIDIFRPKSGGGCVYADMSSVMLSYITRGDDVKAASDLVSPVSGVVVEVNEGLAANPELINQDAAANWIMKVRLADPAELEGLLGEEEYGKLMAEG